MITKKLYYENIYAREFDSEIINSKNNPDGTFEITLAQTLFYPGGGGQPCDLGFINGVEVINVFEDHTGEIIHVLKNNFDTENLKNIHGVINWQRRFEYMQQHLGEHIFAGMLYKLHGLNTSRMRIENDNISLDIDDQQVELDIILEAEREANKVVWQNIPVEIIYPDIEEIKLHARKLPGDKAIPPFRVVKVGDVDYVPCCGTHPDTTGQIGLIKVISAENHKGGTRIYLHCGSAAYEWLHKLWLEIKNAESELVCGDLNITEKILNLKHQIRELKNNAQNITRHFLKPLAENLINNAEEFNGLKIIVHVLENSEQDSAKELSRLLTEQPDIIALVAAVNNEGAFLMFSCNKNSHADVRKAFKSTIETLNGKGGGAAFSAQGHCGAVEVEKLRNALAHAKEIIKNQA